MRRVDESNLTAEYVALHDGLPGQAHECPARFVLSRELLSSRRTQHSNARWSNQSHEPNRPSSSDDRSENEPSWPKADLQSPHRDARKVGGGSCALKATQRR